MSPVVCIHEAEPFKVRGESVSSLIRIREIARAAISRPCFYGDRGLALRPPPALSPKNDAYSRVTISGLEPSQWYFTWFFSTPMPTAWQLASDSGTIVATVPTGLPTGSHRVVVQDSAGAVYGWADLTVQSELPHAVPADSVTPASSMVPQNVPAPSAQPGGALPQTGIDVSMLLATAVSLLLTGLIAAGFILSRRRRHETRT